MEFDAHFAVARLIPYARNSRTHNETQISQIVASVKEFGFTNPILIGADDVIIAGHRWRSLCLGKWLRSAVCPINLK